MESTNHFVPAKVPTVQDQVLVKEVPVVDLQPVSNLGTKAIHASLYSTVFKTNIIANGKSSLPQQRYLSQKRVERAANIHRLRQKTQEDSTEDDEVLKPVPTIEAILSTFEVLPTNSEVLPVEPVPTIEVLSTSTDDSEDDDSEDDSEDDDSEDDDSDEDEDETTQSVHILEGVIFNSFPDYVVAKRKRNDKRLEDLGLGPSSSFANKRLKVTTDDRSTMPPKKSSTKKAPPKKKKRSAKNTTPPVVRSLRKSSRISGVKTQLVALDLNVNDWNNNNNAFVITQNGKSDYEDPIRKMDRKKKRSYTAPATSNDSFCADFFDNDPTTTSQEHSSCRSTMAILFNLQKINDRHRRSQKLANCKSKLVDAMKAIKPKLIEEHPVVLGIVGNRVDDHAQKWVLEPMQVMVSGRPISEATTTDPDRKIALMIGNYPKATLSEKDNHQQGLWGMFEKVNTEGSDSEFRFKNPSIDQVRSNFGEIGPNESITCEEVEEMIVAVDVFPFQLFYRANVSELLDILKKEYPEFYALYIAYSKLEFESIAQALKRAGQDPNQTPVFTLGSTPYDEITKSDRHLNFVVDIFQSPGRTCHPCSLIDPSSTCGLKRFKESDETLTRVSRFITGDKTMNITYHQRFYERNQSTIEAVLKRRSRTAFGGPDQSELSKRVQAEALFTFGGLDQSELSKRVQAEMQTLWRFDGPDQSEESKRVQALWTFGGPDQCEASKEIQALWTFDGPDQSEESKRVQALWTFGGPDQCEASKEIQALWTFDGPDQSEESKRVQALWTFGGPDQCEASKEIQALWAFDGPNQCEASKKVQAQGKLYQFTKDEQLWNDNLKRALRYAATINGPIPMSVPRRLRGKGRVSADEKLERTNIEWVKDQRKAYSRGYKTGTPMDDQRKNKLLASGLLECEVSSSGPKNHERLWDGNLKRALRYAATTNGTIPMSMPRRLRGGRVLSSVEKFERINIRWISTQQRAYSHGYIGCKNTPMEEQRKIKFQASGLLR